ncbi:toll/interleukin-1 receptor domain-containing protein [Leucobacter sp. HY1910]
MSFGAGITSGSRSGGLGGSSVSKTIGGRTVVFSPSDLRTLKPVRQEAARIAQSFPDRRDIFLCHAWDDRQHAAKDLHDKLEALGVSVWFSEKDIVLGKSLIREIDKGLSKSRIGIVLVTPSFYKSLASEGVADKELSVLLASDRLIPITHGTTFEELRDHSPMLASKSGLTTEGSSLDDVAAKLADTVSDD